MVGSTLALNLRREFIQISGGHIRTFHCSNELLAPRDPGGITVRINTKALKSVVIHYRLDRRE